MRYIQYGCVAILSLLLFVRGILPAMTSINTDFPNYYTSARLLIEGRSMEKIYNDAWFQQQIYSYGMDQLGKFSPFPPITAFVMMPLVFLHPLNALRVWTILNIGCLVWGIMLLARITEKSVIWSSLVFLLSGHALANNFKFGQFYLILTVMLISGYGYWIKKRQTTAGLIFGVGAAIKYFPILFFPLFALWREWRIVVTGIVVITVLVLVGVASMGPNVHEQFISNILGNHLAGNIQNPFSATFQSWNSLFRRLFVFDPIMNPNPVVRSSLLYAITLLIVYSAAVLLLVAGLKNSATYPTDNARSLQFALLAIAGLLLLPASATYHFLLLILPVAIILNSENWTLEQKIVATLFALIGFIPYSNFSQFENRGILAIFAYPRLFLTAGLFIAAFMYVSKSAIINRNSPV